MLLTVDNFTDEHNYLSSRIRALAMVSATEGVAWGLELSLSAPDTIHVSAGVAIDHWGRLLCLSAPQIALPAPGEVVVYIIHNETFTGFAPGAGAGVGTYQTIDEAPQLSTVLPDQPVPSGGVVLGRALLHQRPTVSSEGRQEAVRASVLLERLAVQQARLEVLEQQVERLTAAIGAMQADGA